MQVRNAAALDSDQWRRLWDGYTRFYGAVVPPQVTERTWARILDPASPVIGRVAEREGRLVGLTVSVLHEATWAITPVLYLEDLFVDPDTRGGGIGRALMQDVIAQAEGRGCARLYWHTEAHNAAARRLYDTFVQADDFVRYRMVLGEAGA